MFFWNSLAYSLPFCISFSWGWSWSLPPVQCHKPSSIVLQALCLSDLIPWVYLSLPLYNRKGFDLGHTCTHAYIKQNIFQPYKEWNLAIWNKVMDLEAIILSEINKRKTNTLWSHLYGDSIKKSQAHKIQRTDWLPVQVGQGQGEKGEGSTTTKLRERGSMSFAWRNVSNQKRK